MRPVVRRSISHHGRVIVDLATLCLDRGARVDLPKRSGATLYIACEKGRTDAVQLLLDRGAYVDRAPAFRARTPFYVACENDHLDAARLCLDRGASVNTVFRHGESALYHACKKNQIDVVRLVLERGADVDRVAQNGLTPLHVACAKGNVDAMRLCLDHNAEVDRTRAWDERTPLFTACYQGPRRRGAALPRARRRHQPGAQVATRHDSAENRPRSRAYGHDGLAGAHSRPGLGAL